MYEVKVRGEQEKILLTRLKGEFYATSPNCSHAKRELATGVANGFEVVCPWHDAAFDLRTGQPTRGPALKALETYPVTVKDGKVSVALPRTLEKFKDAPMAKRDPKNTQTFAIIGGGAAAMGACETLRQEGFTGRIVLITNEPHLPYERTVLTKNILKTADELLMRPAEFYQKNDIEVMLNTTVSNLDSMTKEVTFAGGAKPMKFDKVLVATGSSPKKLPVAGYKIGNIFTVRTPDDTQKILAARRGNKLNRAPHVVVAGSSFVGMEMASTLARDGCEVTVLGQETVPLERVLGRKVGAAFANLLRANNVRFLGRTKVTQFIGDEVVTGVETSEGEVLPADMVIVGVGVIPNTDFVTNTPLASDLSMECTPLLNSPANPDVYAAGDVCSFPCLYNGGDLTRIEHWDVAVQQGRIAAKNMLNKYEPYTTVPFFWTGIHGKALRYVGVTKDFDQVLVEGELAKWEFIAYYCKGDNVVAVATMGRDPLAAACVELMKMGQLPKTSEILMGTVNGDTMMQKLKDAQKAKAKKA